MQGHCSVVAKVLCIPPSVLYDILAIKIPLWWKSSLLSCLYVCVFFNLHYGVELHQSHFFYISYQCRPSKTLYLLILRFLCFSINHYFESPLCLSLWFANILPIKILTTKYFVILKVQFFRFPEKQTFGNQRFLKDNCMLFWCSKMIFEW